MDMKYTCNGPRVMAVKMREDLGRKIADLKTRIEQTAKEVGGPLVAKLAELEVHYALIAEVPDDTCIGRQSCGADLTAQIEAIPEDGLVYEYQCPKCGNTGTVRKTKSESESEAA